MYYTYIIYSEFSDRYYVGSAQNVEDRLERHNSGHSISTKGKGPWKLIIAFSFDSRAEAMTFEIKIKKRGIKRFLQNNAGTG